jgi:hypothetical protein
MMLEDVLKAVEGFTEDELQQLKTLIDQREQQRTLRPGTLNIERLLDGLAQIREGLTDEEFAEIEQAMNDEYIESLDNEL